jgi:hypothetical protein
MTYDDVDEVLLVQIHDLARDMLNFDDEILAAYAAQDFVRVGELSAERDQCSGLRSDLLRDVWIAHQRTS